MGTNTSYGGSSSKSWDAMREAWSGLGAGDSQPTGDGTPPAPPGDVQLPLNYQPPPALDILGEALATALAMGLTRRPQNPPSLSSLLPRRRPGAGGGAGGVTGATGSTSTGSTDGSGKSPGRSRRVTREAARGGAAVGAAVAYRDRDAAALAQYGASLDELDALGPRQRNNAILNLVLGDAGHPDEAAVRVAALEQVKVLTSPEGQNRSALEAIRAFIGQLVVQMGLVELKDQYLAGTTTKHEVKRRETSLRQWVASKIHNLDLAPYGSVTSRDCHAAAFRMAADALRLMGKKS
jgi:hypothetical protein